MAADSSSTLTSTSHTLSGVPAMAPATTALTNGIANGPTSDQIRALLASLQPENRHAFLHPTEAIPTDSLKAVKQTLEAFATQVGEEQEERRRQRRSKNKDGAVSGKKRKRLAEEADEADGMLKVRRVYVDGFETGQVWQQAKKVIGGVLKFSETLLEELEQRGEIAGEGEDDGEEQDLEDELEGDDVESDLLDMEAAEEEEGEDEDEIEDLEGALDEEGDMDDGQDDESDAEELGEYVEDPEGLNDGFFNLDDFNKQSQWFEDQDARGDPNTDAASDDEEIDWTADPMTASQKADQTSNKKSKAADDELEGEDEEDDDEDDGPTFGDMALDAPEGDSEDEAMDGEIDDDEGMESNANEVYYKDFFAPPPRKRQGDKPKKSVKFKPQVVEEDDVNRAMADVRRDLFDDESEVEDSEDALSDVSAGDPRSRRSTHERKLAKLSEEIRKLEAASVAKREWTLSGEATAVERPMNSLLEEDLDFEHVGKPVPVITPEISESIEDLIKRRILAQEFDEVVRRRPDSDAPQTTRRGMIELDDSKPNKSLAEVYEEEHVKNADPDSYVSKSDEKLQREEKEIEGMWRDLSARLDALSSWHYKPKPSAPSLSVVSDVATIAMEDAQPATAQGVSAASSSLAPQEIYKAGGSNASKGEVVSKNGLPVARQEMSREDKTRRRRREKERIRNAGGLDGKNKVGARAKERRDLAADLKKGGVKVINRKGEITDVEGNKARKMKAPTSGSYKL